MTDRGMYFLATVDETCSVLEALPNSEHVVVLAVQGSVSGEPMVVALADLREHCARADVRHLYVVPHLHRAAAEAALGDNPRGWGGVNIDLPVVEQQMLPATRMLMRTHPYQDHVVGDERSRIRLFERIRRRLKPRLSRPVFAQHVDGGPIKRYPEIGYSVGAARWVDAGGILGDVVADRVRYLLPSQVDTALTDVGTISSC